MRAVKHCAVLGAGNLISIEFTPTGVKVPELAACGCRSLRDRKPYLPPGGVAFA